MAFLSFLSYSRDGKGSAKALTILYLTLCKTLLKNHLN